MLFVSVEQRVDWDVQHDVVEVYHIVPDSKKLQRKMIMLHSMLGKSRSYFFDHGNNSIGYRKV